jgi:hypothetical protein
MVVGESDLLEANGGPVLFAGVGLACFRCRTPMMTIVAIACKVAREPVCTRPSRSQGLPTGRMQAAHYISSPDRYCHHMYGADVTTWSLIVETR